MAKRDSILEILQKSKMLRFPDFNAQPSYQKQEAVLTAFLETALFIFVIIMVGKILHPTFDLINIALLFILPVLFSATRWGMKPSIFASLVGVLAFDVFFVPPVGSITVADLRYLMSFAVLLAVGIITGTMATRLRDQAESARRKERRTAALYSLSRKIAAETSMKRLLHTVVSVVAETFDAETMIFMPQSTQKLKVLATSQQQHCNPPVEDRNMAEWAFKNSKPAGLGSQVFKHSQRVYLPLITQEKTVGVLGVIFKSSEMIFSEEQFQLLEAFSNLSALAILRLELAQEAQKAHNLEESERLRTALFNSISHELRTPLASITGAVTSLLEGDDIFTADSRRSLLQNMKKSAHRMNRLVSNLLDMARIESGMMRPNKQWCDTEDIIGVALRRVEENLGEHSINVEIMDTLPLIQADYSLLEQVLANLLDNAIKYSPPDGVITVSAQKKGNEVLISVSDEGAGIPEKERHKVFDKFFRREFCPDSKGTGLGLSICRGIVEAHKGNIWVEGRPGGGSIFILSLPLSAQQPKVVTPTKGGSTDE